MSVISIFLIAIALSLDTFAVSIASGVIIQRRRMFHALRCALSFGLFQMVMPLIGWAAGGAFKTVLAAWDHWVAFGLLTAIGAKMIYEAFAIESLEESPQEISHLVLLGLSLATSIDALVVGISFAFLDVVIASTVIMIGGVTFAVSFAGFMLGAHCGRWFEKHVEAGGGVILILIGLRILVQHLFGQGL